MLCPNFTNGAQSHYPPEPHMDAAAHEDWLQAKADEHEAQKLRAYKTLIKDFGASTPDT